MRGRAGRGAGISSCRLTALVALLVAGYSPMRVGFYAIGSILAAAAARALWHFFQDGPTMERFRRPLPPRDRVGPFRRLNWAQENAVAVSMACAVAGITWGSSA